MVEFDIKLERFRDKETGQLISGKMFKNIGHAAASISKDAKRSIKTRSGSSSEGSPPYTRRGLFRRAIRYEVNRQTQSAVIGFVGSQVGESAKAHEFGGRYKGQEFPERPTMAPALKRAEHRLGGQFVGRIGG
jgi:hypothetical protein